MLKVMAVLRTLFLLGISGYLLWALPLGILFSGTATRDAACFKVPDIDKISSGAWFAVAWIALETVLGWIRVGLAARREAKAARNAAAAPPTGPLVP
jgi:hypothetical protein